MERLVSVSRNLFGSVVDGPEVTTVPMAELVLVTLEQEYKPQLSKPLIEGGNPQFGLAKVPVAKTLRFTADKASLQMLMLEISGILGELGGENSFAIDDAEPEAAAPSGLVIVS